MGRGSSGLKSGVQSNAFFDKNAREQAKIFEENMSPELADAFREYAFGMEGGSNKKRFDEENGLSDFIDSSASRALHVADNPTLYRGGTITDEEYRALKVGQDLSIMDSKNNLTSWSNREVVAHMYAEESKSVWGQGGAKSHDVVIVDSSRISDAIVFPYTYPQNEVLRSRKRKYKIDRIVDESKYTKPIGRGSDTSDYYTKPVTYIYVSAR